MARMIIGAGAGYCAALLLLAIQGDYYIHQYFLLRDLLGFAPEMLAPILVGAVMGWAWHTIAVVTESKDD